MKKDDKFCDSIAVEYGMPRVECASCHKTAVVPCKECRGTGWTTCTKCGGDGKLSGLCECPCQYDDRWRESLRCETCDGAGKHACPCVRDERITWKEARDILGNKEPIDVMAERNLGKPWTLYRREDGDPIWRSLSLTVRAKHRINTVMAIMQGRKEKTL